MINPKISKEILRNYTTEQIQKVWYDALLDLFKREFKGSLRETYQIVQLGNNLGISENPLFFRIEDLIKEQEIHSSAVKNFLSNRVISPWALAPGTLEYLDAVIKKKQNILEFGSGLSTEFLALKLSKLNNHTDPKYKIISLEQDESYVNEINKNLENLGLTKYAKVLFTPLAEIELMGKIFSTYNFSAYYDEIKDFRADFVIIDGPSGGGFNRWGSMIIASHFVKKSAVWMLDDAIRDVELKVLSEGERNGVTVKNIFFKGKGVAEGYFNSPIGDIKRILDQLRNGTAINPESTLNHNAEPSSWETIKKNKKIRLYAGDIPEQSEYDDLVGLSITKNDFRHILHDVTNSFPLSDSTVDSFQSEDVFEHIPYELLPHIIDEIYRVLKPDSIFRLSLPDYGCDILQDRSLKNDFGEIVFDPGGGGTIENPGHLWYPQFENVRLLLSKTKFADRGKIEYLHYWNTEGKAVTAKIDYSKGFIKRTPDNDARVQNPYRPLSIVVDLTKSGQIQNDEQTASFGQKTSTSKGFPVNNSIKKEFHGTEYGGWFISPKDLHKESIVYSFGIGEDISFDLSIIEKYGVTVHGFDPTPKSINWVRKQKVNDKFKFLTYGIADFNGTVKFYPPENPDHVSHTLLFRSSTAKKVIEVPVKRLSTIMKSLHHQKIDLLKMDIEGAEYSVLENILDCKINVSQILVEFHDRFEGVDDSSSQRIINKMINAGYEIFSISSTGYEYSFIKTNELQSSAKTDTHMLFEYPVVLITYNRPQHTKSVLNALKEHNIKNLFIFSDAPKTDSDVENVNKTRSLIEEINWTNPVKVYQTENQGLAKSIVTAANLVFEKYDRLVLLEDDCVPQKYFFDFMYTCLNKYEKNEKIYGISGYSIPIPNEILSEYPNDLYFCPRIGSWGWATWKRAWKHKINDLNFLNDELKKKNVDLNQGGDDVPVMFEQMRNGSLKDVWTMSWLLSIYLKNGVYIYPTKSHIANIGLDGTGVHCGKTNKFDTVMAMNKPNVYPVDVVINKQLLQHFVNKHNLQESNPIPKTTNPEKREPNYKATALDVYKTMLSKDSFKGNFNKLLNLGCGSRFHKDWVNVDFVSYSKEVMEHDLKNPLPYSDGSFDVVYHSHVLEHFQKAFAPKFLKNCFNVLRKGGIIRVVVPDLEQIVKHYLDLMGKSLTGDLNAQAKYDWIMLELFDQTVRNYSGGEMLKYWQQPEIPAEAFVVARMGSEAKDVINSVRKNPGQNNNGNGKEPDPMKIGQFRLSGEIHQWMYDRYSLSKLLKEAGFTNIKVTTAFESIIPNFNKYNLDIEPDNSIRKPDSLFMEAIK